MTTTININGLDVEFSEKVPTRAGFWLWTQDVNRTIYPTRVWQEGHMFASSELGSCTCIDDIGGLWSTSPLVPAVGLNNNYIRLDDPVVTGLVEALRRYHAVYGLGYGSLEANKALSEIAKLKGPQ